MTAVQVLVITLSVINFSVLLVLFYLDSRKKSPTVILWLSLAIFYVLPSTFDFQRNGFYGYGFGYLGFSAIDVLVAQLYTFYILMSFLLFRLLISSWVIDWSPLLHTSKLPVSQRLKWLYFTLLILLIFSVYSAYTDLFSSGQGIGWISRRENISGVNSVMINHLVKLLSGFSLLWLLQKKYYYFFALGFFFLTSFFLLGGSRLPVVLFFLPVVAYWLTKGRALLRFMLLSSSYGLFSFLMDVLRLMRFKNTYAERFALIIDPMSIIEQLSNSERTESSLRFFYYSYVSGQSYSDTFFSFNYFFRSIFAFLPSFIARFKPDNFEYDMHQAATGMYATMHPTMFGSLYADSAYFGVFWVVLIGLYIYMLPKLVVSFTNLASSYISFGLLCGACLMIGRGAIYGAFVSIILLIFLIMIPRLLKFKI